jgi:hypothetical protein
MTDDEFEQFRMGHLVRTAEVWKRMAELGADEQSLLDFDFSFNAKRSKDAEALCAVLSDYEITTTRIGTLRRSYILEGKSGPISWTEEQLLKWVDYLIAVGRDVNCEFDGCGALVPK